MALKYYFLFFILIISLIFYNCSSKTKSKLIKKYFDSGKLKSYGKYINDTIPIDTVINFYENGNMSSIMVYDAFGHPKGESIFYHENGKIFQIIKYENGLAQDFSYEFGYSGKLKSKIFFLNDYQLGDSYYYDTLNGNILAYNFYDFSGHNLNFTQFDSLGRVIKNIQQRIFIDSINACNDSLDKMDEHFFNVRIVISNPPKCRTDIIIKYFSQNGFLMEADSIMSKSIYFTKKRLPDSLSVIKVFGSLFDSLTSKTIYQYSDNRLKR